ncbi:MAG TPA: GNAT family N-acetyltransferase [Thermoflexales bacterium]|nr:GNAT family N-acetyltransferase [Thermoflexales bacterium]HQY23613.1 GNAT family N-acetyltransferase [Thermoflexales bacterium]HQZ51902.1 GNAT family N-acetyltransferase [Thermoflexales bacterium]HRA52087.1 GNAT family N-acetyltransferase [Thermoflexales bacterium]
MQLPSLVSAPHGMAFIALHGDLIAGAVTVRFYPWNAADVLRLFVRAGYRRRGIALALLRQAQACAHARGCASLRALAMAGMSEGIATLRAAGFVEVEPFVEVPAAWEPVVFLRVPLM